MSGKTEKSCENPECGNLHTNARFCSRACASTGGGRPSFEPTDQQRRMVRVAVRRILERAFGREERAVLKTQRFDTAPSGMTAPDCGYHRIANAAMVRSLCGRVLGGPERDAVFAYWTARGIAQERQQQCRQQAMNSDGSVHFRSLGRREFDLWMQKDEACVRLSRSVIERLGQKAYPDLVLDLVREWAGLIDAGQRARLAAAYERTERAARYLRAGRRDRGQVGVHQILDEFHHAALDRLADHLVGEDVEEGV